MSDESARERIIQKAVEIFSQKGFHGTSMRELAGAAECSLPTLYYHYNSKNELFEEIVVNRFLRITDEMNRKTEFKTSPEEIYYQVYLRRKELQGFDKDVYKMALKVWLGLEGSMKARDNVAEWEKNRAQANRELLQKYIRNDNIREDIVEILINYMESVINKTILLDQDLEDEAIKRQIRLIFQLGK